MQNTIKEPRVFKSLLVSYKMTKLFYAGLERLNLLLEHEVASVLLITVLIYYLYLLINHLSA